ncbi:MAG TPA: ribonuclease R [Thermodesulfovibrionales bacterium]|nr:ribonuclease R [Thermodesulfovibrionales bacterium]
MVNRETILTFFREKTGKPLGFKEIVSLMKLSHPEARALKRLLRQMMREGDLVMTRKGLYGPAEEMNLVNGYFEAHRDGYGFVILEKPGERDIFVPARRTSGAMNHDRVIVRVENWQRREGRIIRILERATTRIVGELDVTRTASFVRPKNRAVPFHLYVSPGDRGKARHGDKVIAEIISYPADKRPPSAKVIKVLEEPEDPMAEVESIIEEFNLPLRFPRAVHDEARILYERPPSPLPEQKRKDLRDLATVTIDGERAKDFDDAVSISLAEQGYRLWVHIADVGFYVGWNTVIDDEARKRGTSVYFPDRVIPMLPKELSEDLCSLKPQVDRYAFTVEMDFDRKGERVKSRFYPSLIRSAARMTYTSVRKILVDQDGQERQRYDHLLQAFELMNELCNILRQKRLERGSLDFDLPEPEVLLDLQGNPEAILKAERNLAHMIIEEFMIAANEAVAEHLENLGVPSLYRVHEEPDPLKLEEMLKIIRPLIRAGKRSLKPKDFSQLLLGIKGTPGEEVINYVVLRSLKQARYSPINVGHFGLASKCYTHFTSPIRRYPDLVVHRILREVLSKRRLSDKRMKELEGLLSDIAFHASRMERLSDDAEREVISAMRVWFMKDKVGEEYEGRITGVTPYGLRVRLKDFYVEGFIHLSYLTDDFYQYNERNLSLSGRNTGRVFTIGKDVKVSIDKVDREEREIVFGLV